MTSNHKCICMYRYSNIHLEIDAIRVRQNQIAKSNRQWMSAHAKDLDDDQHHILKHIELQHVEYFLIPKNKENKNI